MGPAEHLVADTRSVVNVLTGFLGSGKTTLLRRLLDSPAFAQCAVLVNELGEVALDHQLLERIDQETVVLRSGCICCGVRSDMAQALQDLTTRRDRGEIPYFDRVVIETTGLADPVPIINTVLSDPMLRHHYRLATVVTTVDAVLGLKQLRQRAEARKQAAVADRIVITKADMVADAQVGSIRQAVAAINASCDILESRNDATEVEVQMTRDLAGAERFHEANQWFFSSVARGRLGFAHGNIRTVSLVFEEALDWAAFGVWLSMLLHRYGENIMRVKGVLDLKGVAQPTVVHGVQHLLHPPIHLPEWPEGRRQSRLVLIGTLPSADVLQRSLESFLSRASQ